jgi:hypothetical protein
MSEFIIKKANKRAKKLRLGISAASGFGKTYGALLLAKGLCNGDLSKTCAIDTERGSASLYADLGDYSTIQLDAPYTPEKYIEAMSVAEKAGFEVIIVDSITHEWDGQGGCLEIQQSLGGRYQDWAKVTPRHDAFINKILTSSCHVITTVRRKQEYEMSSSGGRTTVQKVGTKEVTREGFEYELDINFEVVNKNHLVTASKDRTKLFDSVPEFMITEETGKMILKWCSSGTTVIDDALEAIRNADNPEKLKAVFFSYKNELETNEDFIAALKKRGQSFAEQVKQ